jgi:hypothetical protein
VAQAQCGRGAHEWNTCTFWPAPTKKCARTRTAAKNVVCGPLGRTAASSNARAAQSPRTSDSQWCPALNDGSRLATPPAARAARKIRVRARAPRSPVAGSSPICPGGNGAPGPGVRSPTPTPTRRPDLAKLPTRKWGSGPCARCTSGLAGSRWGRNPGSPGQAKTRIQVVCSVAVTLATFLACLSAIGRAPPSCANSPSCMGPRDIGYADHRDIGDVSPTAMSARCSWSQLKYKHRSKA